MPASAGTIECLAVTHALTAVHCHPIGFAIRAVYWCIVQTCLPVCLSICAITALQLHLPLLQALLLFLPSPPRCCALLRGC